ncbi:EAL domain-containing protein [Sphingomonas yunnanensis]|nr:EAL domain-containing protein [Sphingomonas yunnanensis]
MRTPYGDRWLRAYAKPRRDASGAVTRWYGTLDDIDDRKRAEQAILGLARQLDIAVLAEGVETAAQAEYLLAGDCADAQGYLSGRAMPAAQAMAPLAAA